MPIVTQEQRSGYATCARDRLKHGACPGYESREIPVIVETTSWVYGDFNGHLSSDPYDQAIAHNVSHSSDRVLAVHDEDNACIHCGSPVSLSVTPRPQYERMTQQSPDFLVELRAQERARAQRDEGTLSAAERQATALEEANALEARRIAAAEEANRLRRIELGLEEVQPRTRPSDRTPRTRARSAP